MSVRRIACLANSYKHDHRCVAGIDLSTKRWVRLIGNEIAGCMTLAEASYADGNPIELLDVFEVEPYEVLVVSVLTAGLDVLGGHIVPSGVAVGRDLAGGGTSLSAGLVLGSSIGRNARLEARVPRQYREIAAPTDRACTSRGVAGG